MIALGCDHGGYELKQEIIAYLKEKEISFEDCGCFSTEAVDYPEYARKVSEKVVSGECEKGILICGTGIGISIAANKVKGIRAALVQTVLVRKLRVFIMMPMSYVWEDVWLDLD